MFTLNTNNQWKEWRGEAIAQEWDIEEKKKNNQ